MNVWTSAISAPVRQWASLRDFEAHVNDRSDPHRVRDLVPASRSGEGAPEALEADKPGDIYFDTATSELYVMREVAGVPSWLPVGSSETTAAAEAAKESADAAKASVDALVAESAGFARTSDLEGVAKTSDLSSLAKASDLEGVARTTDLSSLAKTTDLSSLAKTSDLDGVAKTSDLSSLAKASDLDGVAKTSDLSSLAKASDLSPLAKASDLSPLAKASDLDGVAKTSDLSSLAKASDLEGVARTTDLSSLAKASDLEGVAKTTDLSPLAKASAVVEVGEKVGQICTVLGGDTDGDTVQAIVKKILEKVGDEGQENFYDSLVYMMKELYGSRPTSSSVWLELEDVYMKLQGRTSDGSSSVADGGWDDLISRVKTLYYFVGDHGSDVTSACDGVNGGYQLRDGATTGSLREFLNERQAMFEMLYVTVCGENGIASGPAGVYALRESVNSLSEKVDALTTKIDSANAELETIA